MFIRDFPLQANPLWDQQYLTEGNKSEYQWLVLSLLDVNPDLFLTDTTAARLAL